MTILVTIIVIEIAGFSTGMVAVRLLRLMRAVRVLRTARVLPGLTIIIETIVRSSYSVFYIIVVRLYLFRVFHHAAVLRGCTFLETVVEQVALLFMYVFAVVGVSTFGINDPFHFGNLGLTWLTLLRVLTFDSWSVIMYYNIWSAAFVVCADAPSCKLPDAFSYSYDCAVCNRRIMT